MDIRDDVVTYATYRILWFESDLDRGYMVMGVEMVGWWGIDELRRSVRLNQVIGN
jgi:sugar (pentulose or hexulose) kinase